jgi:hypothetical protein
MFRIKGRPMQSTSVVHLLRELPWGDKSIHNFPNIYKHWCCPWSFLQGSLTMTSTSAKPRRASAPAPKSLCLDSHPQRRLEQNDQQEHHTGTSPSQALLELAAQPATQCQPAEIQSNLRKVEKIYQQFLRTIDDSVRDKEVTSVGSDGGK